MINKKELLNRLNIDQMAVVTAPLNEHACVRVNAGS